MMTTVLGIHIPTALNAMVNDPRSKLEPVTMEINADRIAYSMDADEVPGPVARLASRFHEYKLVSFTGGPPEQGWLIKA